MKIALQTDIASTKKYIKEVQICIGEVYEYITRKKNEHVFLGTFSKYIKRMSVYY